MARCLVTWVLQLAVAEVMRCAVTGRQSNELLSFFVCWGKWPFLVNQNWTLEDIVLLLYFEYLVFSRLPSIQNVPKKRLLVTSAFFWKPFFVGGTFAKKLANQQIPWKKNTILVFIDVFRSLEFFWTLGSSEHQHPKDPVIFYLPRPNCGEEMMMQLVKLRKARRLRESHRERRTHGSIGAKRSSHGLEQELFI